MSEYAAWFEHITGITAQDWQRSLGGRRSLCRPIAAHPDRAAGTHMSARSRRCWMRPVPATLAP